jgi:hypothetical protein
LFLTGAATSQLFVNAHLTQFKQIETLKAYEIESVRLVPLSLSLCALQHSIISIQIANRNAPFGYDVLEIITSLPKFEIHLANVTRPPLNLKMKRKQTSDLDVTLNLDVQIQLTNQEEINDKSGGYLTRNHLLSVVVGDEFNNCLLVTRLKLVVL